MGTIEWIADSLEAGKQMLRRPINELLPPSLLLYLVPPLPSVRTVLALSLITALAVVRLIAILPSRQRRRVAQRAGSDKVRAYTVGVFLGSGGHTTELLQLVSALPTHRYARRIYLISSGDRFSLDKAKQLESKLGSRTETQVVNIPRARNVHQSFISTPLSLAYSIAFCLHHIALRPLYRRTIFADVILMNGPGTCLPIVLAVYLLRWLGISSPKLIYVESFARVKSLSLTARLVRPLVDRFILQWPQSPHPISTPPNTPTNTVYSGWLI